MPHSKPCVICDEFYILYPVFIAIIMLTAKKFTKYDPYYQQNLRSLGCYCVADLSPRSPYFDHLGDDRFIPL